MNTYRSYHQDYPTSKFIADLVNYHLTLNQCSVWSMARYLYEREPYNWERYMEAYLLAFHTRRPELIP